MAFTAKTDIYNLPSFSALSYEEDREETSVESQVSVSLIDCTVVDKRNDELPYRESMIVTEERYIRSKVIESDALEKG